MIERKYEYQQAFPLLILKKRYCVIQFSNHNPKASKLFDGLKVKEMNLV